MAEPGQRPSATGRAGKSPAAFRTIREVAEELEVPQHVLRFWETKFPQLKPLKRGGGRRYYRPGDVALLRRIRALLYDDGYTIRGVQKLLREGQVRAEAGAAPASGDGAGTPGAAAAAFGAQERARLKAILEELEALRDALRGRP